MKLLEEFKAFAVKGNVVDLAVGVIIGAAFGKIVTSFVNDIFMPPLGVILGGVNFKDLKVAIGENVFWNYGAFIQSVVDFLIIAFAIFMLVKAMNKVKKKEEEKKAEAPKPSREEEILIEIRDELRLRGK
jgi:large conductance mechanosensitive channel